VVIHLGNHAISLLSFMASGTLSALWMAEMVICGVPQKKITTTVDSGASAPQKVRQHSYIYYRNIAILMTTLWKILCAIYLKISCVILFL